MKNFELISFANPDELASRVAGLWLDEIESAQRADKNHCVALSGGRITHKFFASVVAQNQTRNISFARVHFFWADERCVPPTDPESNFQLAHELLFAPLKILDDQIHRLRGEDLPPTALKIAEEELRRFAAHQGARPVLDLILLGMGEDGHVASLFPHAMSGWKNDAADSESFLFISDSPKPPPRRISLNYEAIIAARNVWALVSGAGKENALKNSLAGEKTPLGRVLQKRAATTVFSDLPPA